MVAKGRNSNVNVAAQNLGHSSYIVQHFSDIVRDTIPSRSTENNIASRIAASKTKTAGELNSRPFVVNFPLVYTPFYCTTFAYRFKSLPADKLNQGDLFLYRRAPERETKVMIVEAENRGKSDDVKMKGKEIRASFWGWDRSFSLQRSLVSIGVVNHSFPSFASFSPAS